MATVLVIDDEHDLCLALKLYLERMGHQVLLFHSASATKKHLQTVKVNALFAFVDHQLGSESGTELAVFLVQKLPGLHVILMSGLPLDEEELPQFSDAKVVFLQKPFRSAEVADCLRKVV